MHERTPSRPQDDLRKIIERTRELVAKARELISGPPPDTFLGRSTKEPFPKEHDK